MKRNRKPQAKRKPVLARDVDIEVATAEVDNPDWRPDLEGEAGIPRKVSSAINLKESAVEVLFARKVLTKLQKKSADMFRAYYEAFAASDVSAIDYSRDHVDGGSSPAPVTNQRIRARKELARCRNQVGARGYALLVSVCGQGRSFAELYPFTGDKAYDAMMQRQRLTSADNLRDHLYDIGRMWGLATSNAPRTVHIAANKAA